MSTAALIDLFSTDDYYIRLCHISDTNDHFMYDNLPAFIELYEDDEIHIILGEKDIDKSLIEMTINYHPSCLIVDGGSVWPGNTNADSIVNINDILPIGIYWNQLACERVLVSDDMYKWEAQPLLDNIFLDNAYLL